MAETVVLIHIMCVGWMRRTAIDIDYFYTAEIGGIVGYDLHIFGLVRVQIMKVWYYNIISRCSSLSRERG